MIINPPYDHAGNIAFGSDLTCLGDISGDGIDDLWISQGGRNYIYYGGQPFDTIPDLALDWSYMTHDMVENIGDINNDGYNDVLLTDDAVLFSTAAYIYCYPGMDTLVDAVYTENDFAGVSSGGAVCCIGICHSRVGDINNDGFDDVLISGRSTNNDALDYGWIFIQSGWDEPTAVDDESTPTIPNELELRQNRPNPFNSGTTIEFSLPRAGHTEVRIFNIMGEVVAMPLSKTLSAGEHQIHWDGRNSDGRPTSTGVYFYRITSGDFSETRKMVLLK